MQYNTVQHSTIQYSTVQYSTAQYSTGVLKTTAIFRAEELLVQGQPISYNLNF
jgi:hypothetical protein